MGEGRGSSGSNGSVLNRLNPFRGKQKATGDTPSVASRTKTPSGSSASESGEQTWNKTIERITPAIVALTVNRTRHFEGSSGSINGTGFVVDKKRGIILTNRHVVTLGPVVAEAQFSNMEIIPVQPVYRDPVHDFAFFQFDPKKLEYMELEEIQLAPQEVEVGSEIRVVGNDNGEQLTILSGTISRTDRDAPSYDINTFYITSASSTSGGSSGSPVVNIQGHAVALNSGGLSSGGATSFFLPLERVLRALEIMRETKPGDPFKIPRGTLQCVFRHVAFEELRRLGLPKQEEQQVRQKDKKAKGMLIVAVVAADCPAHRAGVQSGDILLRVEGKLVDAFLPLAELLDDRAQDAFHAESSAPNQRVNLKVQRGDKQLSFDLPVSDLHALTPTEFLEVSDAVIHPMSYAYSVAFFLPLPQLVVAFPGYMLDKEFIGQSCVIVAINDRPTSDLDSLEEALSKIPDGEKALVRYFFVKDKHRTQLANITMDRRWFPMRRARRNPVDGLFVFADCSPPPPAPKVPHKQHALFVTPQALLLQDEEADTGLLEGSLTEQEKVLLQRISKSLVWVEFSVPVPSDGRSQENYAGCGIVLDHEQGLVLVDQNTVVSTLGDAEITIAESAVLRGTAVFVHPVYNYAFIKYDPKELDNEDMESLKISKKPLKIGDRALYAGITGSKQYSFVKTKLTSIDRLNISENPAAPSFTCKNQEIFSFEKSFPRSVGGVVVNSNGKVQGFHGSFAAGGREFMATSMPVGVRQVLRNLRQGLEPQMPFLGISYAAMSMAKATKMGLSSFWFDKLDKAKDSRGERMCLVVNITLAGSSAAANLENGDVILSIDGEAVVTPTAADALVLHREADEGPGRRNSRRRSSRKSSRKRSHELLVLRNTKEVAVNVDEMQLGGIGTTKVVAFAGLITQPPPLAVSWLGFLPDDVPKADLGVYTSGFFYGSPAERYNAPNCTWIRSVNGEPCRNIEEYKDCVKKIGHSKDVRIEVMKLTGRVEVFTLRTDLHYWETTELIRDPKTGLWTRIQIEHVTE